MTYPRVSKDGGPVSDASHWENWLLGRESWSTADRDAITELPSNAVPGWKPRSIRPPVIVSVIVVSLALAATVEYLAQKSSRQGGLALSVSPDDIPTIVTFSYLALPTVFAILYGLVWSWIDLDVRRIQPWFDLSRPGGSSAHSSLLVDYPFEFLAFVPFKAWKHRHWPVFLAGTAMMVIFWAITPLQATIFGTQTVALSRPSSMGITSSLPPLGQQAPMLDISVLYGAYGSSLLGQSLPPYTTPSYAILPFSPLNGTHDPLPGETWAGRSTKLSTDLACWPARVSKDITKNNDTYSFENGRGCNATVSFFGPSPGGHIFMDIGYWDAPNRIRPEYALDNPNCTREASHQFLAIFTDLQSDRPSFDHASNISAMFCEPSYWKQEVSVTVSADSRRPIDASITTFGPPSRLSDTEFNITAFEYFIGTGQAPVREIRDFAAVTTIEQGSILARNKIVDFTTHMVGFALALYNGSLDDLHNATTLQSALAVAHRLLFSYTVSHLLMPATNMSTAPGLIQYTMNGVVVSRPFSLAVEGLLVFVAVLAGMVLLVCHKANSNLTEDPSSLRSLLGLLEGSDSLLREFMPMDNLSERGLFETLEGRRYQLYRQCASFDKTRVNVQLRAGNSDNKNPQTPLPSESCYEPVRPRWLRPTVGLIVVGILMMGVIVLVYLKKKEVELGGLPRPTADFEVLQVLENYIPLAFATLLEPFLLLVTRLLCLLQPFHELRRGHAPASTTIDTTYASLPPQLNVFRALKARHFLLAFLCMISIMANALAVALGALFNEFPTPVDIPVALQVLRMPSLGSQGFNEPSPYYDHFYVAISNFSTGNRLPPWIDTQFAYLPVSFPNASNFSSARFGFETRGFGFDITCSAVSNSPPSLPFSTFLDDNAYGDTLMKLTVDSLNGSSVDCYMMESIPGEASATGALAYEVVSQLNSPSSDGGFPLKYIPEDYCAQNFVASWLRAYLPAAGKIPPSDLGKTAAATTLYCQPILRTAMFHVSVDPKGYILQSERKGDFDVMSAFLNRSQAMGFTGTVNTLIGMYGFTTGWHNTSVAATWMGYLARLKSNSSSMVDPEESVPDPSVAIPLIEDLYRRLTASIIGLNIDMFQPAADDVPPLLATVTVQETRIFMNYPAFAVSVGILVLSIGVIATLYTRERDFYLPRLPSSIASLIPYVAASRIIGEPEIAKGDGPGDRHERGVAYSFGSYVGLDGRPHVGIERDPFVVPLSTALLQRPGEKTPSGLR